MRQDPFGGGLYGMARWCVPFVLFPLLGCGPGQGTVSGRVMYQNAPVPGGIVTFIPTDPKYPSAAAIIDENGRYKLTVTAGEVRIAVENEELKYQSGGVKEPPPKLPGVKMPPVKKGAPPPPPQEKQPGKYRAIPEKYYSAETSGLRYTVTSGSQTYDVELK